MKRNFALGQKKYFESHLYLIEIILRWDFGLQTFELILEEVKSLGIIGMEWLYFACERNTNFEGLGEGCYRLRICAPFPMFIDGNLNAQSDSVWRWGPWEVNEISALIKGTSENSITPSPVWGHSGKMVIHEPGSLYQMLSHSSTWPGISNLQNWEIRFLHLQGTRSMLFCYSSQSKVRHSSHRPFCQTLPLRKWARGKLEGRKRGDRIFLFSSFHQQSSSNSIGVQSSTATFCTSCTKLPLRSLVQILAGLLLWAL